MAGMVPEDVFELTWVGDPRIAPDGKAAAVVVMRVDKEANEYRGNIWLVPLDGSGPPRQFTSGAKVDSEPRWSPDGSRLAFASNRGGEKEPRQLYVLPATGGEPKKLTDLKEDVGELAWSPDSSTIAFSARVRDEAYEEEDERKRKPRRFTRLRYKLDDVGWTGDRRRQLFVVPADGSAEPTQLTSGEFEHQGAQWSPDGKQIAFVSQRDDDWDIKTEADIYLVSPEGGEPRRLTGADAEYETLSWSPDGRQIACVWGPGGFDFPRHGRIAVVDAQSGETTILTADLDLNASPYPGIREPVWEDGTIVFGVEQHGNVHLYRVAADGSGAPEPLTDGVFGVTGYDLVDGRLIHTRSTPTMPSELYEGDTRLTEFTKGFCEGRELVEPERFTATSADGSEVEAWLVRPVGLKDDQKAPMLLSIHGGPFTQYANKLFDEFQIYAAAGYAVVYSNPRGSSGYSEEWGRAIRGPVEGGPGWGTVDYDDLMAVTDQALEQFDFVDADRLGVLGGSYGGYMTSWIVSHTDRFKAACSERAVNNLYSEFGSSDIGWAFKGYTGAYAFDDPQAHLKHSPITYASDITTPLLIMHSENDLRCDVEQAEQLFIVLRLAKREVEFVRFPGEGHELSRSGSPAHRVMRFEILLDWFDRHLK